MKKSFEHKFLLLFQDEDEDAEEEEEVEEQPQEELLGRGGRRATAVLDSRTRVGITRIVLVSPNAAVHKLGYLHQGVIQPSLWVMYRLYSS